MFCSSPSQITFTAFEENHTRYGKLPQNSWSSETEERRLFWNMTSCDRCDKMRRFPPYFDRFFPADKDYEFCCEWNVWDNYNSCDAEVEGGCNSGDPDEVTYSEEDMERIMAAHDEDAAKVPAVKAGPAAKKARPAPLPTPAPGDKKRGRGRPPGSKTNASKKTKTDEDEEGDGQEEDSIRGVRGSALPPEAPPSRSSPRLRQT